MKYLSIFFVLLYVGCNPHKVTNNPAPVVPIEEKFSMTVGDAELPERWWEKFNDPTLNRLVEQGIGGNLQLKAAWARFRQARAVIKPAKWGHLPELGLQAQAARQKTRFDLGPPVGEVTPTVTTYSLNLGASYEIDLWKRLYNQLPARVLDAASLRDDVSSIAMTLAGEITGAWFDLINLNAQKKLIASQLKTSETFLELIELRYAKGLVTALDVYQQKQQVAATRAQLNQLLVGETGARVRLAILLGESPSHFKLEIGETLPEVPAVPGTGIPADLLHRRPDVRAAMRRVESADYDLSVEIANMMPRLTLSAGVGYQSDSVGGLFDNLLWNLVGGLTQPIFQRGVLKAKANRQRAVVEERVYNYSQVFLQAIGEVETAAESLKRQKILLKDYEEQVELAAGTFSIAEERYQQGLVEFLQVLTAMQGKNAAEIGLLQAQRNHLAQYIQLCRALGGTWTQDLSAPKKPTLKSLSKKDRKGSRPESEGNQ